VQTKAKATDRKLERVVVLMDGLFAIDREAREQKLSLDDRTPPANAMVDGAGQPGIGYFAILAA